MRLFILPSMTIGLLARSHYLFDQKPTGSPHSTPAQLARAIGMEDLQGACSSDALIAEQLELPAQEAGIVIIAVIFIAFFLLLMSWTRRRHEPQAKYVRFPGVTMARFGINILVLCSSFGTGFIPRYYISSASSFWPTADDHPLDLGEAWSIFKIMHDESHTSEDYWVWMAHAICFAIIPWILFSPTNRSLLQALTVAAVFAIVGFLSHFILSEQGSPEAYCIRNIFLADWDGYSGLHVLAHVALEMPMNVNRLFIGD
ncbi:hypothetical protein ACHAWF_012031 [Thalassiosira exigua]